MDAPNHRIPGNPVGDLDCIMIPGGGLAADGRLPPWTEARLEAALDELGRTRWVALLSGGTVHKPPPRDADGFPRFESRVLAAALIDAGVEPERILTEISSYDTIGNAYFSRLLFAEPFAMERLLVITSAFHIARTQQIFDWIYSLPPRPTTFRLEFMAAPDRGISDSAREARAAREAGSVKQLQAHKATIRDLPALHRWLYREHRAYAPAPGFPSSSLSARELESY